MSRFNSQEEYRAFIEDVARNGHAMGETPQTVAEQVVVSTTNLDEGKAMYFGIADDYVDDPSSTERVWPKDVLQADEMYPYPSELPDDLRGLAVNVLAHRIEGVMRDIQQGVHDGE